MVSSPALPWSHIAVRALVAGAVGGAFLEAYVWATALASTHASITAYWQWIASTVLGKTALTNPAFAWAGLAIHFGVSAGWAGGYAYLASTRDFLNRRWPISGIVYGAVVYFLMQIVLLADQSFVLPANPAAVVVALAGHCLFYGLPLAYAVRALSGADAG
ncbi:MAG TPA: hypothetical protein VMF61_00540 [Candidatus Acidoferrales bacterium]|nr:hypothetical protein [Candidatus Acidoferrales bacterium]